MAAVQRGACRRSRVARETVAAAGLSVLLLAACGASTPAGPTPAAVEALLTSGLHAQASGDFARADADYLSVVKAEPGNSLAWYDLGVIAQQRHQDTNAVGDYDRAISPNARYVPALYNLAILETASDPKLAAQLYERSIAVEPKDADAYLNLGFVERTLGHAAAGDADIAKAVALDPSLGRPAGSG
jgi:tetratricopeptide (TPR) repeat protein